MMMRGSDRLCKQEAEEITHLKGRLDWVEPVAILSYVVAWISILVHNWGVHINTAAETDFPDIWNKECMNVTVA